MADSKKISELHKIQNLNDDDEFIVVDKSAKNGPDASTSGKTSRVTFDQLKTYIGSQGPAGEKGPVGPQGADSVVPGPKGEVGATSTVPGPKGSPSTQKGSKGAPSTQKGPKGEPMKFTDMSTSQKNSIKGPQGDQGASGPGFTGGGYNASTGVVTFTNSLPGRNVQTTDIRGPKGDKSTEKGPKGDKSTEKGPKGDKSTTAGPKGHRGNVANANAHLGLKGPNCAMSFHGHHIYKINGNPNSWDAGIYSQQSYTGGCILSFRPATTDAYMMIGINGSSQSDPVGSPSYQSLDYAFYCAGQSDDRILIYESGKSIKEVGKFTTSTVFTIKYDGSQIHYYVDGDEVHTTVAPSTSMKFHMDSSIVRPVSTSQPLTSLLSFIPLEPGPPGPASTEKGPKGDVGATFSYNPTTKVLTIT
jgi:hypothetical protein